MLIKKIVNISLVVLLSAPVFSQDNDHYSTPVQNQRGFVFTMAELGSGLGGFYAWALSSKFHLGFTVNAFSLRDSKEFTYYDYYYGPGSVVTLNKQNNVYIFDALFTVKRRFFAEDMDESFRPFLTGAVGPVYGMNFPEFSRTPDGFKRENEYRFTIGGYIGGGVDITVSPNYFLGVRAQYRIMPFTKILGERKNHSMIELRLEIGQRY